MGENGVFRVRCIYRLRLENLLFFKIFKVLSFKQTACGIKGFKVSNFIMIEDLGFFRIK